MLKLKIPSSFYFLEALLVGVLMCQGGGMLSASAQGPVGRSAESIGIISSVSGESTLTATGQFPNTQSLSFRHPVVYGDRIHTGENAVLALLVANNTLVTAHELSEFTVTQSSSGHEAIQLFKGQTCLATPSSTTGTGEITVRTPGTIVTTAPGSTIRVTIGGEPKETRLAPPQSFPKAYPVSFSPSASPSLIPTAGDNKGFPQMETIEVLEGSADLVSHLPGVAPVNLTAGTQVQVMGGSIGSTEAGAGRSCRVADISMVQGRTQVAFQPPHTSTPAKATKAIVKKQQTQANQLVALVTEEGGSSAKVAAAAESTGQSVQGNPPDNINVIIPTTGTNGEELGELASPDGILLRYNNSNFTLDTPLINSFENGTTTVTPNSEQVFDGFIGSLSSNPNGFITAVNAVGETAIIPGGIRANNSILNGPNDFIAMTIDGHAVIDGSALELNNSSVLFPFSSLTPGPLFVPSFIASPTPPFNPIRNLLRVNGTFTGISTLPLFDFSNSVVNNSNFAALVNGGSLGLQGPLLRDQGGTLNFAINLYRSINFGSLVSSTLDPLIQLENSNVFIQWGGVVVLGNSSGITPGGALALNGPVLRAQSTTINSNIALFASLGTTISRATGTSGAIGLISNDPFVSLTQGSTFTNRASFSPIFRFNTVNQTSAIGHESDIIVFHMDNSMASAAGEVFDVDNSLIDATAPLAHILNGSTVTTGQNGLGDFASLRNNSTFTADIPNDALVMIDASTITLANGSFINADLGSSVTITGSLLALNNGGMLNINNGFLINVTNASSFSLTGGSLAVGGGTGPNTINITNNATGGFVSTINGLPIHFANGASPGQVSIDPAFQAFQGVTVNTNGNSAAVIQISDTSTLTLSP